MYISSIFFFQFFPIFLLLSINSSTFISKLESMSFLSLILTICLYIFKTKFSPFPLLFSLSFCFFTYFSFPFKNHFAYNLLCFLLFMTAELSTKKLSFSFIQIKSVDISKQGGTKNEDEKIFCP